MTAKDYLQQAYKLDEVISSLQRERDRLGDLAASLPSQDTSRDIVSASKDNSASFTKIIEKIDELDRQIASEMNRLVNLKAEIHGVINAVPDRNEMLCLRYRYIEYMSWEKISEKMNYSVMQVTRIHGTALSKIIIPKRL